MGLFEIVLKFQTIGDPVVQRTRKPAEKTGILHPKADCRIEDIRDGLPRN